MKIQTSKLDVNYINQVKVKQLEPGLYIKNFTTYLKMGRKGDEYSVLFDADESVFYQADEWIPESLQIAPQGHELKFIQD